MAVKVTHILKSGKVLESIEGYEVPFNEDTKAFYMSIVAHARDKNYREIKEKSKMKSTTEEQENDTTT